MSEWEKAISLTDAVDEPSDIMYSMSEKDLNSDFRKRDPIEKDIMVVQKD